MKGSKNSGFFSVELASKKHLVNVSISDKSYDRVLFEGFLGKLTEIEMIEDSLLEFKGVNGVIRVDMCKDELWQKFSVKNETE
jgi:hypothetical protein